MITCFCTNREHYWLLFSFFAISFVAFVCILYQVIFACCAGMFVWLYQILKRVRVVSDECNANLFCDISYLYFFKNTFSSEVYVLSDIRPFRNLTFYNVLARQGSSFCNFPSFRSKDSRFFHFGSPSI